MEIYKEQNSFLNSNERNSWQSSVFKKSSVKSRRVNNSIKKGGGVFDTLIYKPQQSYSYTADQYGRVNVPTFNEVFPGVFPWDKAPDALLKKEYKGKGFAYQDVYNNYVNALHRYNKEQTIRNFPGAASWYVNQERKDLGLNSLGRTNYDVFAYPLIGAMTLPAASALSGAGLLGAAKYTISQTLPFVAKKVVLPYLAGEVWNEANKIVTGNYWATNVANGLENLNVPRDWGMAIGNLTNPLYFVPWNGVANVVTDQAGKAAKPLISYTNNTLKGSWNAAKDNVKGIIVGRGMNKAMDVKRMPVVYNAFRNNEWNNFVNTRNGDYYYRLSKGSEYGQFENEKNYFLSHTTPWEEFSGISGKMEPVESGIKSAMPNGYNYLIEIPTETFGKLQASTSNGVIQKELVTDLGRKHLLYGNTSSRRVGPVKYYSDAEAAAKGKSSYEFGHVNRPLNNGLYDKSPIYEDTKWGNQTVVNGKQLNDALGHTTYNVYENTSNGILKTIYFGDQVLFPQPSQMKWNPLSGI